MKKILLALGMTALFASSAMAHGHDMSARNYSDRHHRHYHAPRPNYQMGIGPGIFFGLGNGIITLGPQPYLYHYDRPHYRAPRMQCDIIEERDDYGYVINRRSYCYHR